MIVVNPIHQFDYAGASFNVYHANMNEGLPKHEHTFAHATICNAGSCILRKEGREKIINKFSKPINLAANEWHEIEALEDGTVFVNIFENT